MFSAIFVFQKSYTRNILGIGQNKSRSSLFIWHEDGVQRWDGAEPGGGHTIGWRGPTPGRARPLCRPHAPSDIALPPINSLHRKTLRAQTSIPKKYYQPPPSSTRVWEGPEALPGTLPERGIITGGLLHRHSCLQSNAWVVHLGLWVHSSSWMVVFAYLRLHDRSCELPIMIKIILL
jgi:hypothetical protein